MKSRGPVSVALPADAMAGMKEKTDASKGSEGPSSMTNATTAVDLSVKKLAIVAEKFCDNLGLGDQKLTSSFEDKINFHQIALLVNAVFIGGVKMGIAPRHMSCPDPLTFH